MRFEDRHAGAGTKLVTGAPELKFLLDLAARPSRQVWIGHHSPFRFASADLIGSTNFRLSSSHHHRYEVVWAYEREISGLADQQYEILIDESLRLLGEEGLVVLRYQEGGPLSRQILRRWLDQRLGVTSSLRWEAVQGTTITSVFQIKRLDFTAYAGDRWTFALLIDDSKGEEALKFIRSVRRLTPGAKHEILVAGPPSPEYDRLGARSIGMVGKAPDKWYCGLPLRMLEAAQSPNICYVDGSVLLGGSFFSGFAAYGYDFDFLCVRRWHENEWELPNYCAASSDAKGLPIRCSDYGHLHSSQYAHGFPLIAKTHVLRKIGSAESIGVPGWDVKLGQRMRSHSLPPRVNFLSSVVVCKEPPSRMLLEREFRSTVSTAAGYAVSAARLGVIAGRRAARRISRQCSNP